MFTKQQISKAVPVALAAALAMASFSIGKRPVAGLREELATLRDGLTAAESATKEMENGRDKLRADLDAITKAATGDGAAAAQLIQELREKVAEAERRSSVVRSEAESSRREWQSAINAWEKAVTDRDNTIRAHLATIQELRGKIPSSKTQVKLAGGIGGLKPNAKCEYCGAMLMIGEIKEREPVPESQFTRAQLGMAKNVHCPKCNEAINPDTAMNELWQRH